VVTTSGCNDLEHPPFPSGAWYRPSTLKSDEEKSKHACLAHENGFGSAFLHSLLRLVKMQQSCAPAKDVI